MFTVQSPFPGVAHITDAIGVSFTLLEGEKEALLVDAGYGTEDVNAFVRSCTGKPVHLLLTHGHHDHVLGARWFAESRMDPADLPEFRLRTGLAQRQAVQAQAASKGIFPPEDFLAAEIPEPKPVSYTDTVDRFSRCRMDLGGRTAWLIRVPGHTAGSIVLYLPELQLLLTGDNWNPCTWMWFPCSLPARQWRENMLRLTAALERETGKKILHVLCSHQPALRQADEMKEFLKYMTDERLREAKPADLGKGSNPPIHTCQVALPDKEWVLVFDKNRAFDGS